MLFKQFQHRSLLNIIFTAMEEMLIALPNVDLSSRDNSFIQLLLELYSDEA